MAEKVLSCKRLVLNNPCELFELFVAFVSSGSWGLLPFAIGSRAYVNALHHNNTLVRIGLPTFCPPGRGSLRGLLPVLFGWAVVVVETSLHHVWSLPLRSRFSLRLHPPTLSILDYNTTNDPPIATFSVPVHEDIHLSDI